MVGMRRRLERKQNGAFAGRMKEFSEKVHEMGMKFGLWFEIERAVADSESVKLHPDYYIPYRGQYFVISPIRRQRTIYWTFLTTGSGAIPLITSSSILTRIFLTIPILKHLSGIIKAISNLSVN